MAPPRSRKQKPRQTALSFTPKPTGTPNSSSPSQSASRKPSAGGVRPRKKPNASILNFFQKVPRGARGSGDGLFVEGEYDDDDDDLYSGGPIAEERGGMVDEELMGLFEEETAIVAMVEEGAGEGRGRRGASVMFPTPVKAEGKKPVKGPFMVDDSGDEGDTPTKSTDAMKREIECSPPPPPPPMPKKRKMPFELEEDEDDEEEDVKTRESNARLNKHETDLSPPVLTNGAGSSTLNDTAATSIMDDEFIDDEMLNNDQDDEDIDTPNGDDWEVREEQRYLEMLQEQESTRMQDENDTPQCPICSQSLERMKEDEATRHVNHCLDGGGGGSDGGGTSPTPGPSTSKPAISPSPAPASTSSKPSAFTHLMTSLTESRLWATAAASEALRNPTRQRRSSLTRALEPTTTTSTTTIIPKSDPQPQPPSVSRRPCPFYKLIFPHPVSVAMDAFKYGAIPGVDAYFLSHFHSDHYGGLTSTWSHGLIWCTKVTANLVRQKLGVDGRWVREVEWGVATYVGGSSEGETLWVNAIPANHCPGSAIFLFERQRGSRVGEKTLERVLHTGDFRAAPWMLRHPLLAPYIDIIDPETGEKKRKEQWIDTIYLDTTYLNPRYTFPGQSAVVNLCAEMCVGIDSGDENWSMRGRVHPKKGLFSAHLVKPTPSSPSPHPPGTLLVVIGTYSIGKERLCLSIALALNSKIYAPKHKLAHLSTCLDSPLLTSLLTSDPLAAQVHMVPLMEIRPEVLSEYLNPLSRSTPPITGGGRFTRVIGFRPTGWTYKPAKGSVIPTPTPTSVRRKDKDKDSGVGWTPPPEPPFTPADLAPGRGSRDIAACYAVPYSEHSSFRELACFCCGVNVRRVIPTVNVGKEAGRKVMGGWVERWKGVGERRRKLEVGGAVGVGVGGMGSGWEWEEKEGEGAEEGMFMGEEGGRGVFMGQRE